MTQSTYGWWAAWLLEQRVKHQSNFTKQPDILFYKYPYWNNTRLGNMYVRETAYPKKWKAYSNNSVDT